jgi:ribose transport system substrate-binding protein
VAIFDSAINSDNIITYIATDNYEAGKMGGRRMGEILGGKGKVGVVGFMPGSASTMAREKGFIDAVAEEYPDIEVLDVRYNMADRAKALAEAENLMTANPDLTGLFADNESSTDGVVRAVKQRNAVGRVKIVGFDASQELVAEMKAGVIDSIIVQDPFRMGYESTHAMVKKLDGGEPLREVDSGSYLLTPDNVDSPELQAVVFPDLERWLGDGAGGH